MQLLFKTIIILTVGLSIMGIASLLSQNQLQKFWERELSKELTQDRKSVWENLVRNQSESMHEEILPLIENPLFQNDFRAKDLDQLKSRIIEWLAAQKHSVDLGVGVSSDKALGFISDIAIFDAESNLLFNSNNRLRARVSAPIDVIRSALSSDFVEHPGIGYDERLNLLHSVVVPIHHREKPIGVIVYSRSISSILEEMQGLVSSQMFIVNRNNRLLTVEAKELWHELSGLVGDISTLENNYVVTGRGQTYRIIPFPISDMYGSLQTFAVIAEAREARQNFAIYLAAGSVLIGLVIILIMGLTLRRIFRPLGDGTDILISLAKDRTIDSLGNQFNDDEIGRILNAIETLRLRTVYLKRLRRSRLKQRQRVHSVLFNEISLLANNLDKANRGDIEKDLRSIKAEIMGVGGSVIDVGSSEEHESGSELVTVASAFRKLAYRITQKQNQLNRVILDLEEALKTEVAYYALQKELNLAHHVQLSFIPDAGLKYDSVELLGYMYPAKTVGGDLFDYFSIDDEQVGFCVGDVSDKGVPAALFMMVSRIVLWLVARQNKSASETISDVNAAIHSNNPNNFFVSIFYGRINVRTGLVNYACAGHPPGVVVERDSSRVYELDIANDLVVGIFPDVEYQDYEVTLSSGDFLFVYSDGISEAMDIDENQYSLERLLSTLGSSDAIDVKGVISSVIDDVTDFTGDCAQSDDITCIVLQYNG